MQETNMIECRKISKQYFPTQFVRVIGDTAALPGTMTPTACLETFNESIRKNKVWLEESSRDAISMQTECVSAEGVDPWPRPEWCMVLVLCMPGPWLLRLYERLEAAWRGWVGRVEAARGDVEASDGDSGPQPPWL